MRLGGKGTPKYEVLGYVPRFDRGIPVDWITQEDIALYQRPSERGPFLSVAIDPNDPPVYESEAAYLRRQGLLLPRESDRLVRENYAPARVV